jgi:signal transduction histidine kinase
MPASKSIWLANRSSEWDFGLLVANPGQWWCGHDSAFAQIGRSTKGVCAVSVTNMATDLLENRSFPEISAALRERADLIVKRWEEAVRRQLPSADEMTLAQVRDHIPQILDQMATALASDRPAAVQDLREMSQSHGEVRFHQHYNVRELIIEYRLLRRIVVEEIHDASGGELSITEMIVLDMGVDTALQQGLLAFINHQRQQIQAATEVESKYLRFLSHDLRNNLNQVILVLDLLKGRLAGMPEFEEDLGDVTSAHSTILNTIAGMDALLQTERLRKGAIQPKAETVRLPSVVTDLVRHLSAQARQKGLSLIADVSCDVTLSSDRELIALALQNLVGNAIKYSSAGTVRVSIERWKDANGQGCSISVSDQGPGIAPEDKRRIFEAFARGETHGQPGVGLGLAIAFEATRLLGGKLTVESEVGVGSTFRLLLPTAPDGPSAQ